MPFKSAQQVLDERALGEVINKAEKMGGTFQREFTVRVLELAKAGKIKGLFSLDPELDRSFSKDPINAPFALDRTQFPTGQGSFMPRRFVYYVEGDPWKMVVVFMEHPYPELLPASLSVPVESGEPIVLTTDAAVTRAPDYGRAQISLRKETVKILQDSEFRVLPRPAEALFKLAKRRAAVRQALSGFAVLPTDTYADLTQLRFATTDWNLPLEGRAFIEHLVKGRNTLVALQSGFLKEFNITLADKAAIYFRHREAFIPYETLVTMAVLDDTGQPKEIPTKDLLRYQKDPIDPTIERANPLLEQLRSTETRFKPPYAKTYVTFENVGAFDARLGTVVFRDIAEKPEGLVLPPERRVVVGKKLPDGRIAMEAVELPYLAKLSPVAAEVRAVASSLRAALPKEMATALERAGPRL